MKPALRRLAVPLILLLVVIGLPSPGAAVPPHLDLGFNAPAGYAVFAGWGSAEGSFNAAADQPDGKHVLVGVSGYDLLVARYNADWSVDASFGAGKGFALYETSLGNIERGYAVAIQPDGMIVAGGIVQDGVTYAVRPLVVRFTAAGELDTGFGGGDGAMAHESDAGEVRALLVQADGKILVGIDQGYSWQTILVRLNGDGTYDASFGGGSGRVAAAGSCFGLVPLADGKFVRAGSSYDGSNAWVWLRRFTRTGADDGSFGGSFTGDVRAILKKPS